MKKIQQSFIKTDKFDSSIFYAKFMQFCLRKYQSRISQNQYIQLAELRQFANLLFKLNKKEAQQFIFDFSKYFDLTYNSLGIKFNTGGLKCIENLENSKTLSNG